MSILMNKQAQRPAQSDKASSPTLRYPRLGGGVQEQWPMFDRELSSAYRWRWPKQSPTGHGGNDVNLPLQTKRMAKAAR